MVPNSQRSPDDSAETVNEIVIVSILYSLLLLVAAYKTMFYIRVYESYGQLVELVTRVMKDVVTFSVFFIGWLLLFSFMYQTIGIEVEGLEDTNVNRQVSYLLRIFRNSVGDLDAPSMPYWYTHALEEDSKTGSIIMIYYGWFIWLLNVFVMVIVLLNFLIAIIS